MKDAECIPVSRSLFLEALTLHLRQLLSRSRFQVEDAIQNED